MSVMVKGVHSYDFLFVFLLYVLKGPLSFGLILTDFFSYNIKSWNLQNDTTSIFKHLYTFLRYYQLVFNERHGEKRSFVQLFFSVFIVRFKKDLFILVKY